MLYISATNLKTADLPILYTVNILLTQYNTEYSGRVNIDDNVFIPLTRYSFDLEHEILRILRAKY